jgi:2-polyprenyl-6-methoxyphenol hydroxylase-like FAD-dependent oxidoreductase
MYDIIIFGGGLSGLTLAHELIKQQFKILIIEKDNDLGDMARSDTTKLYFRQNTRGEVMLHFIKILFN